MPFAQFEHHFPKKAKIVWATFIIHSVFFIAVFAHAEMQDVDEAAQTIDLENYLEQFCNVATYTEIAGLQIIGQKPWHKLSVSDLEIVLTSDGQRAVPLLKISRLMEIEPRWEMNSVTLASRSGELRLSPQDQLLVLPDGDSCLVKTVRSEFSGDVDVFVPPEKLVPGLLESIEWDEASYGFIAETDRTLSIWEVGTGESLLALQTREIGYTLPESPVRARPQRDWLSLDFMNLRKRAKADLIDGDEPAEGTLDNLEQTFWGSLAKGRYKLEFNEQTLRWNDEEFGFDDSPVVNLGWAELLYDFKNHEVALGDSLYGLNDITFPSQEIMGFRANGIVGGHGVDARGDQGLSGRFIRPFVVEGLARVGSIVELYLNGRFIDEDEVLTSMPSDPSQGVYRFDNIRLAPGSFNEIRIEITDPDGVVTIIEENVFGPGSMLPRGALAYLGGLGTSRDRNEWEVNGIFAGGRALYGLTDSLTLGLVGAYQEKLFAEYDISDDERQYPTKSMHSGLQAYWQLLDWLMLSGDLSVIHVADSPGFTIEQEASSTDLACRINTQLSPRPSFDVFAEYFEFGPDFFDGRDRELSDRRGVQLSSRYRPHEQWSFAGAAARIWDNVDGRLDRTRHVNLYNLNLRTSVLPASTLTASFDALHPGFGEDRSLASFRMDSNLPWDVSLRTKYSSGDDLRIMEDNDFLEGLRLRGFELFQTRGTDASLSRNFGATGTLGIRYYDIGQQERISVVHSLGRIRNIPLIMRSELGWDIDTETVLLDNRLEYPLGERGSSRLAMNVRCEDDEWRVSVSVSIQELFDLTNGRPSRVKARGVSPKRGVISGVLFVDCNGNYTLDAREPGVSGVRILLDNRAVVETDDTGHFLIAAPHKDISTVSIDMETLPAIYSCGYGLQRAVVKKGEVTPVRLSVMPVHSVTGIVETTRDAKESIPVSGLMVWVGKPGEKDRLATSITAADGSYYLSDIPPGEYVLHIDPTSLPENVVLPEKPLGVHIEAGPEPVEVEMKNLVLPLSESSR